MNVFWHRRDLRVADNRGLAAAVDRDDGQDDVDDAENTDVLPVFVFDDEILAHAAPPRVRFMLDALAELRAEYRDRGSDLLLAHGDPADVLPAVATAVDADAVHWNEDYTGLSRRRDAGVRLALADADVSRRTHHDAVLHEPGTITTNEDEPYAVFTYFWKKWRDRGKSDPFEAPAEGDLADPTALSLPDGVATDLPSIADLGFDDPEADVAAAGTDAARERLAAFCEEPIFRYDEDRDYPAKAGSSRLSPHLKFGTIGIREVYAATVEATAVAEERDAGSEGTDTGDAVSEFQSQLAWREFYTQVLHFNPDVVTRNYREYENPIDWRDDPEELAAWKAGETGYPIVDAGMRQLKGEAWMHNRVRMIVASFLTKDLLCDWRAGYAHFRRYLSDHDTANDNGGWQWAASTGTDAQPYFRIFNPMTQGERYDPDAEYVREYVPELRGVDTDDVHSWHELDAEERESLAPEYPDPIVDHGERREQALAMFERARGEDPEE